MPGVVAVAPDRTAVLAPILQDGRRDVREGPASVVAKEMVRRRPGAGNEEVEVAVEIAIRTRCMPGPSGRAERAARGIRGVVEAPVGGTAAIGVAAAAQVAGRLSRWIFLFPCDRDAHTARKKAAHREEDRLLLHPAMTDRCQLKPLRCPISVDDTHHKTGATPLPVQSLDAPPGCGFNRHLRR
jgi:hypothetical protein